MSLKKVRAFTLSEMMVVLLLTVIVVGLAFTILNLVQWQMRGIEENYRSGSALNLLHQGLWRDFRTSGTVTYDPIQGLYKFESPMEVHLYSIDSTWVLRDRDSFQLDVTQQILYFEGEEVSGGQIDALIWNIDEAGVKKEVMVFKRNSAENFMKDGL